MIVTPQEIPALYVKHGSLSAISRKLGTSYSNVNKQYRKAVDLNLMDLLPIGRQPQEHHKAPAVRQRIKALKTKKDKHHTFILTCAQNNTDIHLPTWVNLLALAKYEGAKVFVSTFLYSKRGLGAINDKARVGRKSGAGDIREEIWFAPNITPFINNDRVEIANGLVWCGELNILPTAARPLTGLEVYTGRASMVAPHVTVAMESIATVGGDGAKLNYTTGTVTQRNYIQRKEGFKAEFHHSYGALLVEVAENGSWFCRQLMADSEGTIYDLDRCVKDGKVTKGHRVEAITMGDVHVDNIDVVVETATWGRGGLVDVLKPRHQFIHDVLDMSRRSHHKVKDPYAMMKQFAQGRESVADEVRDVGAFLKRIKRKDCLTVVVDSNHDRALDRWLTENDGRYDPVNADYWGLLNHWKTSYIMANKEGPDMLGLALTMPEPDFEKKHNVLFLASDTSFTICPSSHGGIECGMHGDRGANGTRGSLRQFARLGRRSNIGHSHTAGIYQGAWQSGTNSLLKLDYNHGPSAWTHSDIITYANGKRAIITFHKGAWRA